MGIKNPRMMVMKKNPIIFTAKNEESSVSCL